MGRGGGVGDGEQEGRGGNNRPSPRLADHFADAKCRCCQAWNARVTGPWTFSRRRRRSPFGEAGTGGTVVVEFVGAPVGASVWVGTPVAVAAIVGAYVSVVGAYDGASVMRVGA